MKRLYAYIPTEELLGTARTLFKRIQWLRANYYTTLIANSQKELRMVNKELARRGVSWDSQDAV